MNSRENYPLFAGIPHHFRFEVCCWRTVSEAVWVTFKKRMEKSTESALKIRGLPNSHAPTIKRPIIEGMASCNDLQTPRKLCVSRVLPSRGEPREPSLLARVRWLFSAFLRLFSGEVTLKRKPSHPGLNPLRLRSLADGHLATLSRVPSTPPGAWCKCVCKVREVRGAK